MKTILSVVIASFGLLFTACNKNQHQVIKLEGKWNVISADVQGYAEMDPDMIYEFEYCKLKKEDYCDFSIHNFDTNEITNGLYSVKEHGMTVSMTVSSGFGFEYREYDIVKLSNRRLILVDKNAPTGAFSRIELKAVK
ncbi:MAG: hypothetical protein JKY09_04490 [Crocinitomicaceae bacterium]|nr:hypothetical protein [Crocinitomicaceae bacterium]